MTSAQVFISYRREDSAGWAGRLHDDLQDRFGAERVFRDVAIDPGVAFREHIEQVLDRCAVLIAVIGPRWATMASSEGRRRLDDARDLVRREIVRALERPDVHVIPVLVDGARMPAEGDLPPDLAPLTWLNACELSDSRWDYDVDRLEGQLAVVFGDEGRGDARPHDLLAAASAMACVAGVGALAAAPLTASLKGRGGQPLGAVPLTDRLGSAAERLQYYAPERAVVWAVVAGLALSVGTMVMRRTAARRGAVRPLLVGVSVGALAGAAGAAMYVGLKYIPATRPDEWVVQAASLGLIGALTAGSFARIGRRPLWAECRLAGLAGGLAAGALTPVVFDPSGFPRAVTLAAQAVIVVGATATVVAVLETQPAEPAPAPRLASSSRFAR
jgi:TIR domain-containing protein